MYDVTAFLGRAPKNLKKFRGTRGIPRKTFVRLTKNFIFFAHDLGENRPYIGKFTELLTFDFSIIKKKVEAQ